MFIWVGNPRGMPRAAVRPACLLRLSVAKRCASAWKASSYLRRLLGNALLDLVAIFEEIYGLLLFVSPKLPPSLPHPFGARRARASGSRIASRPPFSATGGARCPRCSNGARMPNSRAAACVFRLSEVRGGASVLKASPYRRRCRATPSSYWRSLLKNYTFFLCLAFQNYLTLPAARLTKSQRCLIASRSTRPHRNSLSSF